MLTLQNAYGNKMPILINRDVLISVLLFTKKYVGLLGEN